MSCPLPLLQENTSSTLCQPLAIFIVIQYYKPTSERARSQKIIKSLNFDPQTLVTEPNSRIKRTYSASLNSHNFSSVGPKMEATKTLLYRHLKSLKSTIHDHDPPSASP